MPDLARKLRRSATLALLRGSMAMTRPLPASSLRAIGSIAGNGAAWILPLRRRLATNYELAFGHRPPPGAVDRYFQRLGAWMGWRLAVVQRGIVGANAQRLMGYDETAAVLDDAVGEGRGVVIASPHWFCYEMVGGVVNLRHRLVMLVREQADQRRARIKNQWYAALGVETVRRPRQSSLLADTRACLKILKSGAILGVTPDLPVGPENGVPVNLFDRTMHFKAGAVALAFYSKAPLIYFEPVWHGDRFVLRWQRAPDPSDYSDRHEAVRHGMQAWCDFVEAHLERQPEDWLFWLDKNWTRLLRSTPRGSAAA